MKEYTLEQCLEQQKKVDAGIKHNGEYSPRLAAMAEAVEMCDWLGIIKTWAHTDIDKKQAFMELVDVRAFCKSGAIMQGMGFKAIIKGYIDMVKFVNCMHDYVLIDELFSEINNYKFIPALALTDQICRVIFKRSTNDLNYYYMGKQTLTQFRQNNGYKDGTYQKIWGGREDNEFLTDALEKGIDIDDVPDYLETAYNTAIKVV